MFWPCRERMFSYRCFSFALIFAAFSLQVVISADPSTAEMQQKLSQLKALLELQSAKGAELTPEQKEMLSELGDLEQLSDSVAGNANSDKEAEVSPELTDILDCCISVSMNHLGPRHQGTTMGALKRLVGGDLPPSGAVKLNKFWRLVAVCINEVSTDQVAHYKSGELMNIPAEWAVQAKSETSKELVAGLDLQMWTGLKALASSIVESSERGEL